MTHLYLYTIFHANLQFSCIPEDQYPLIIDQCFWPVVELLDDLPALRLGFEFPSDTLEILEREDITLVEAQLEEAETFRDGSLRRARLVIRPQVGGGALAQGEFVWGWDAGRSPLLQGTPRWGRVEILKEKGMIAGGATEGWLDISDNEKGVAVITNKSQLFSVPLLHFEEVAGSFFLRVYTSIGESDDTAEAFWRGHNEITVTYLGHHGGDLEAVHRQGALINGGLLTIFPRG